MKTFRGALVLCAIPLAACVNLDRGGTRRDPIPIEALRIREVTRLADGPAARLEDGRIFRLLDPKFLAIDSPLSLRCIGPDAPLHCHFEPRLSPNAVLLPSLVDLRPNQTMPFRDQGQRDTCQTFGTVAAIEAAYKRKYGLNLDLSEQYLNHVHKMLLWHSATLPDNESIAGAIGGRNPSEVLAVLLRGYGVPTESSLVYIGDGTYATPQSTDVPNIMDWSATYQQLNIDNFNLSATAMNFQIPALITATSLPQAALETARYRPTDVLTAQPADLPDVFWYKRQLAASREVVFAYNISSGSGHVMLFVGYDDAHQAFMVKNSWGGTSFGWFPYSDVSTIYEAATIMDVADPNTPFGTLENKQLFLGSWALNDDGVTGVLNIYRLPDESNASNPDRRVGTYYSSNGTPYRVNGRINRNQLDFYIDATTPNQPLGTLQGRHFTGYVFSWDKVVMAGTVVNASTGQTSGFHATKDGARSSQPRAGTQTLGGYYVGKWAMNHDGWHGTLNITSVDPNGNVQASYADQAGAKLAVSGVVNVAGAGDINLTIGFPGAAQPFHGYLHNQARGLLSGTTQWGGITFGFLAARLSDAE